MKASESFRNLYRTEIWAFGWDSSCKQATIPKEAQIAGNLKDAS